MGPGYSIYLREPLTAVQVSALDCWLGSFTSNLSTETNRAGELTSWCFVVRDARAVGLEYGLKSCLIGLHLNEPMREMDWGVDEQIMLRLGFWPRYGITVWAGCKNIATGRIMSHLILRLMEQYTGYLDLCFHREEPRSRSPYPTDNDQTPGKLFTISYWISDPYQRTDGSGWHAREIMDAERLRWCLTNEQQTLYGFCDA